MCDNDGQKGCDSDVDSVGRKADSNRLEHRDRFVESATQNFHWDPQEGACVGGRDISRITDTNLMYQFEAGWQCAFGYSFK